MNNIIAFDLEIVKEIPEGVEWKDIRPLGISCVSALKHDQPLSHLWFHKDFTSGKTIPEPIATSGAMTQEELEPVVNSFGYWVESGCGLVTWNGLGFDFDVLAEESGMYDECKELALNHIDMMFHFLCVKGYPVGLDTVARGLGFGGKMAGMSGALAPQLWASPNLNDRLRVLRYVHQDSVSTLEVYEKSTELGQVPWTAKSGRPNTLYLSDGWKTVKECLELPFPDTSWMDKPLKREDFYSWTEK